MGKVKVIFGVLLAGTILAVLTPATASANYLEDRRVFFTFSGPVTVPGATLPAGKYLFRVPTTIATGERHVMQVLSPDERNIYSTFFAITALRQDYPDNAEVKFWETPTGVPPAIKYWWYPGDKAGYEFIYSKEQKKAFMTPLPAVALTPPPEPVPLGIEEAPAPAPSYEPAPAAEAPEPVAEPAIEPRQELPKTAGNLVAIALTGLALVIGAAFLKARRSTVM